MRLTCSRAYSRPPPVPKMPPGLVELMDGLARDVLMHTPSNIYEFCANHMEKLLEIRDGPSSKKKLTLEQKIQRAQEKMRQKAQERREKFDREIKLLSSNETLDDKNTTCVTLEDPLVAGLRAPIHEVDLENSSEVEISHVAQVDKTPGELKDILKIDGSEEQPRKSITDNTMGNETRSDTLDEKHMQNTDTEKNKVNDEPIFGKIEMEEMNVNPLEEHKQGEIVDMPTLDSHLQTIAEGSEENFGNGGGVILPTITIGDECEPDNTSDLSQQAEQLVLVSESKHYVVEQNTDKSSEKNKVLECNKSNNSSDAKMAKKPIISENITELEKVVLNLGSDIEKTSEINTSVHQNTDIKNFLEDKLVKDSSHDNILDEKIINQVFIENSNNADIETAPQEIENEGKLKGKTVVEDVNTVVVVSTNKTDVKIEPEDRLENMTRVGVEAEMDGQHIISDNNADIKRKTEQIAKHGANSTEVKCEIVNATEIHNTDPNIKRIDIIKIEFEITPETIQSGEETLAQNQHDAESSLQKSDSIENTNEDSISMVESDVSKTDDDSARNNPNMDLETAAVTIQKVFRSFMFKSRNSTFEDNANNEHYSVDEENDKKEEYYAAANLIKERRPLGITRMDTVLQTVNEEKSLSLSTDDSSTLSSAATTIQAHVRGFLIRNRLNSSKTYSMNSLVNSHEVLEADEQHKNKTILNIHIVPEEGNYLSRDESLITSMELSLDGSPPSSVNLHPLSCDISERRKMLKREDAVQSVSPPSNNSGKQSEDSVKEVFINENGVLEREPTDNKTIEIDDPNKELDTEASDVVSTSTATPITVITISKSEDPVRSPRDHTEPALQRNGSSLTMLSTDEADVVTPYIPSPRSCDDSTMLVHSGEFHDVVLPTKVSRNDTSTVRGE